MTDVRNPAVATPPPGRAWRRAALVLVLVVTLSQITLFGGVYAWSWIPAMLVLGGGLVALLIAQVWFRLGEPVWHPIFIPVLLFGLLVALQWGAGISLSSAFTLTGLLQLAAGGFALYLSYYAFGSATNVRYLSVGLWLFSGVLAAEALVQFFEFHGSIYGFHNAAYATPVGPFVYHNFYAGAVDLLLPVCLAASLRPPGRHRPDMLARVRRGVIPGLLLASLFVSQSRGGLFTLLVECGVAVVIYWRDLRAAAVAWWKPTLAAAGFLGFAALANWGPMVQRLLLLEDHAESVLQRLSLTQACWAMFLNHPWIGVGFNAFATVYPSYQSLDVGLAVLHAHNEYAQALAETGLLGAGLVIAFLAILIVARWPQLRKPSATSQEFYRRACFVGLVGFLFHSYGDFLFHAPGLMLLFFMLTGVCLSASPDAAAPSSPRRLHARAARISLAR